MITNKIKLIRQGLQVQAATVSHLAQSDLEDVTLCFNAKSESAFRLLPVRLCQCLFLSFFRGVGMWLPLWQVSRPRAVDRIIWILMDSLAVILW